mmetsp:Transcript_44674/g.96040  ORF Transcript_44674/g.96040 Transcript_44674/m.96040 type:complete len:257 (-) Transcript_44674:57-827(-)
MSCWTKCNKALDWDTDFGQAAYWLSWMPPTFFLGVRLSIVLVWAGWIWASIDEWVFFWETNLGLWFTKMTHWSASGELCYFSFAAYTSYKAIFGTTSDKTPWYAYVATYLQSSAVVTSSLVTIIYWAFLYDYSESPSSVNVMMHGGGMIIMLVDVAMNHQPMKIIDVWAPIAFAVVYLTFSLIYYAAGGTNWQGEPYIYVILDWRDPASALQLCGIVITIIPILYSVAVGLVLLRIQLGICVHGKETPYTYVNDKV